MQIKGLMQHLQQAALLYCFNIYRLSFDQFHPPPLVIPRVTQMLECSLEFPAICLRWGPFKAHKATTTISSKLTNDC